MFFSVSYFSIIYPFFLGKPQNTFFFVISTQTVFKLLQHRIMVITNKNTEKKFNGEFIYLIYSFFDQHLSKCLHKRTSQPSSDIIRFFVYFQVHQMMQSTSSYSLYTALPEYSLTDYSENTRRVTLTSNEGKEITYQVSFVVVLIGSRPDLSFLPCDFRLGVNENVTVDSKTNPINIDKLRHSVRGYKDLYAMGPIAGDKFVRFLPGGALAIVADLYKKYGF